MAFYASRAVGLGERDPLWAGTARPPWAGWAEAARPRAGALLALLGFPERRAAALPGLPELGSPAHVASGLEVF